MNSTENIWQEYHSRLSAFIGARVSSEATEDILQEVFMKIHTHIDSLTEESKIESWLYTIARNTIVDYYRAKKPSEKLPEWIAQPQSTDDELIRQELSLCLIPMIEQLPEKYRVAIQLSEIDNKTQKEVAELENISLSGAKSRVQRGRALLKSMLNQCCQFEFDHNNQLMSYEKKNSDCKFC